MKYFDKLKAKWQELENDIVLDNGLILQNRCGHTRKVAFLKQIHEGRGTAGYYTAGSCLGVLSEKEQVEILRALADLQDRNPESRFYGGSRWYSEEEVIEDTNGAFFITMPLLELYMLRREMLPESNIAILKEMFGVSLNWFLRECEHPSNFYPNKVLSDGAALCALAYCMEDESAKQAALAFIRQWDAYTRRRGWGWGENVSPTYHEIILDALQVMLLVLRQWNDPLEETVLYHYNTIIEAAAYHGESEYIPAIRSYNFDGLANRINTASFYKAGLSDSLDAAIDAVEGSVLNLCGLVVTDLLYGENRPKPAPQTKAVRVEPVFDGTFSYSWKGEHIRLGSLSSYPVMEDCYQHPDWGLGWQSMPVSFCVSGQHTGYLRFQANDGEIMRAHPAYNYHDAYLSSGLFRENYLPAVRTNCTQKENVLVATRTIEKLHNRAKMVEDAWVIHNFHAKVEQVDGWVCLIYDNCTLAIRALGGFTAEGKDIGCTDCEVVHEDDTLIIRKALYEGEETILDCLRLENQWVAVALDGCTDRDSAARELAAYSIDDRYLPDFEAPRYGGWLKNFWETRATDICRDGKPVLEHRFDPFVGVRS